MPAAGHQRQPGLFHGRGRRGPLRAWRVERRRREGDGGTGRGARAQRPFTQSRGFRRADRSAPAQPPPAREPGRGGRVRWHQARRAAVFAGAETILAAASSAHDARDERAGRSVRREPCRSRADPHARDASWTLAQRMAAERELSASISPPIRSTSARHLLAAHKVRDLCRSRRHAASPRASASARCMAGLVEDARWRTSAKGRRYMMATLSDISGQFVATAFDDDAPRALDGRQGGPVRAAWRRARPPRRRRDAARHDQAVPAARRAREAHPPANDRSGRRCGDGRPPSPAARRRARRQWPVRFIVPLAAGGEATIVAGRDFLLDAEIAARIERSAARAASTCPRKSRRNSRWWARLRPSRSRRG